MSRMRHLLILLCLCLPVLAKEDDFCRRGAKLAANKDYQGAMRAYQQAVQADPDNGNALRGLGSSALRCGQAEVALDAYERAYRLEPTEWTSLVGIINALEQSGRSSEADYAVLGDKSKYVLTIWLKNDVQAVENGPAGQLPGKFGSVVIQDASHRK